MKQSSHCTSPVGSSDRTAGAGRPSWGSTAIDQTPLNQMCQQNSCELRVTHLREHQMQRHTKRLCAVNMRIRDRVRNDCVRHERPASKHTSVNSSEYISNNSSRAILPAKFVLGVGLHAGAPTGIHDVHDHRVVPRHLQSQTDS